MAQKVSGVKRMWFLIRWWLIGRNYCKVKPWGKAYITFYIGHKTLWIILSTSLIYTICSVFLGVD